MVGFKVEWSGAYPNLCSGEWKITTENGIFNIPDENKTTNMNTYGQYSRWYFGGVSGWEEKTEYYIDGIKFDEWIVTNYKWVTENFQALEIDHNEDNYRELYEEIRAHDFRNGSCKGCMWRMYAAGKPAKSCTSRPLIKTEKKAPKATAKKIFFKILTKVLMGLGKNLNNNALKDDPFNDHYMR